MNGWVNDLKNEWMHNWTSLWMKRWKYWKVNFMIIDTTDYAWNNLQTNRQIDKNK